MRIVQVVHNFLGEHRGGTERSTELLSSELAKRHHVEIVTSEIAPGAVRSRRDERSGLPVTVVRRPPASTLSERLRTQRSIDRWFGVYLRERRPDVVHVQHLVDISAGWLRAPARTRIPHVVSLHDFWFACPRTYLVRRNLDQCETGPRGGVACIQHCRPLDDRMRDASGPVGPRGVVHVRDLAFVARAVRNRSALRGVPRFIAPSEYVRERWASLWLDASDIEVIPLGLPPTEVVPRPPTRLPIRFVFLGRVSLMKGADVVVRAFRDLGPERATLTLHGPIPPDQRSFFDDLLASVPPVRWAGPYLGDPPLEDADVVVIPSRQPETWSLVAHEALQRRVPVMAQRRGALPEVIHDGVDGVLFDGPGELGAAIRRLVDEPDLVDRLRSNIGSVPTIAESARRLEALYVRVVERYSSRRR
ncbi:MAG: glycosyltransferase [Actinomycetota bacterium]